MKVTVITVIIGAHRTIAKGFVKKLEKLEIGGRAETLQTTALLRSARIVRRIEETCCHSDSTKRPSANVGGKNSKEVNYK